MEDDERFGERRKSELADFAEELSKSSIVNQLSQTGRPVDVFATNQSTEIIGDAFVQIFGEPWSQAYASETITSESDTEHDTVPNIHVHSTNHTSSSQHITDNDIISMATNLSNIIIEGALRVYREQLRQQQEDQSRGWQTPPPSNRIDESHGNTALRNYASGTALDVVKDSLERVSTNYKCIQCK